MPDAATARGATRSRCTPTRSSRRACAAWRKAGRGGKAKPVPVPKRVGEPSVFEHVVYVIKENRTYDQVFGDIGRGQRRPELCASSAASVTPNHHALAEQFVLLDNFYCNGVISADGHAVGHRGATPPTTSRRAFGGFTRSYPFAATTRWRTRPPASSGTTCCCTACRSATTAR